MGRRSDIIRKRFQTFCNGTSIHGFVELFYAKTSCHGIFWLLLLSSAFGLTIYQVTNAVNQFIDQPYTTRTEGLDENDMYPPIKLCSMHWVYWLDSKKASSLNFSKDSILYGMSYLANVYTEGFFDFEMARRQFNDAMTLNNFTKMQQFFLSVAKEYHIETSPLTPNPAFGQPHLHITRHWGPLVCYIITGESILEMARNIKKKNSLGPIELVLALNTEEYSWNDSNVTSREFTWYMTEFLKRLNIYKGNYINDSIKNLSSFRLPFLLYVDGFSQDYIPINNDDDFYNVYISLSIRRWTNGDADYQCLVGQKLIMTNSSLCGFKCKSLYRNTVCKCMYADEAILQNEDYPSALCRYQIFRIDNENATMISTGKVISQLGDCWKNNSTGQPKQPCPLCGCEHWTYSFTFLAERFGAMSFQNFLTKIGTIVRVVYPNDYDIFIMVEVENQTWEDFVANIGGLLGIWTGASLLSIVQLFYLCCFSDMEEKVTLQLKLKDETTKRTIGEAGNRQTRTFSF